MRWSVTEGVSGIYHIIIIIMIHVECVVGKTDLFLFPPLRFPPVVSA